ncbi:DUF3221 domain-containing protein [Halobacillus litoralis]|uniref:DUF3221 domain-containing protein n=1 Tax=Halobacillus litoralis TaxID=45668 RepID=A0A845FCY0_9BACI|nr:YobA family protein [Halobacillus litoralis]MYL71800.1 DUF3221 domain-containing protein [Halobacillus litoralis]
MKKILILSFFLLVFFSGCNKEEQDFSGEPTIEGYLIRVEDKEILVVHGITKEQAVHQTWNDLSKDKHYEAHEFHIDRFFESFSDFQKGDKVKVWGEGGANESYPAQSSLGKIERVK